WRQSRIFYQSNLPVIPYYPPHYTDAGGTGTLQHMYNYEVCMTTDSRKSDCKIVRPCSESILVIDTSAEDTIKQRQMEKNILDDFSKQKLYRASVPENSSKGTLVTKVSATDGDIGANGDVRYTLRQKAETSNGVFEIDEISGEIFVREIIDFEKIKKYEINVEARDYGGFTDSCAVIIDIIDVNDNIPLITLTSFTNPVSEDALPGTTIAVINVKDLDSGENGQVSCFTSTNSPFVIRSSFTNYFTLQTTEQLDRETQSEYNITITATDEGSPSLSTNKTLHIRVSDVNDNPPLFEKQSYTSFVVENSSPGTSILAVRATDADCCQNARVSYVLENSDVNGVPASSFVSLNSETGIIYADQNDNAPQILYPVQTGGSLVAEMVPRSADVGYLVTKVCMTTDSRKSDCKFARPCSETVLMMDSSVKERHGHERNILDDANICE
ncbi:protocadherin gamma-A11-like, partial [Scleropages formosus]